MKKQALSPTVARALMGAGGGALVGAPTGYLAGKAMEPLPSPGEESPDYGVKGALIGAGVGALGGGAGAALLPLLRRSGQQAIPNAEGIRPQGVVQGTMQSDAPANREVLEVLRQQKAAREAASAEADPAKARELSDYLEYLKTDEANRALREPSLRMRLNREPGFVAKNEASKRRNLATGLGLPEEEVIAAGKGKYGSAYFGEMLEKVAAFDRPTGGGPRPRGHVRSGMNAADLAYGGLGAIGGIGSGMYAGFGAQKDDPYTVPNEALAKGLTVASNAVPGAMYGAGLGTLAGIAGPQYAVKGALIGGGIGGALGGLYGLGRAANLNREARQRAQRTVRAKNEERASQRLMRQATMGSAAHAREGMGEAVAAPLTLGLVYSGRDPSAIATGAGFAGGGAMGRALSGLPERYVATKALQEYEKRKAQQDFPKAAMSQDPYLLDQIGKKKTRDLKAEAPEPRYRVKAAMIPSAGMGVKGVQQAAKKLMKSQKIGTPDVKLKPLNKLGFQMSQYSGPLGGGTTVYPSYIPPFKNPPVKTAGPPSESVGKKKLSSMLDEWCKLSNIKSPQSQLNKTETIGAPKATAPKGPSIQQVAKPVGFGKPIAGATKTV